MLCSMVSLALGPPRSVLTHPIRKAVDAHRHWFRNTLQELLEEIDIEDPGHVADELVMLRDGAMVSGYLSDPAVVASALYDAGRAIIRR